MMDVFQNGITSLTIFVCAGALFLLMFLLPARVIQTRHGYSVWLIWGATALAVGTLVVVSFAVMGAFLFVPFFLPPCLLWAFALSTPNTLSEAQS